MFFVTLLVCFPVCFHFVLPACHISAASSIKDFCDLTLDPNTAHRNLKLSDGNKKVTRVEEDQLYPDHDHRFDHWPQVLCTNSLSGRCYWEVEWSGEVHIAVTRGGIRRKGADDDSRFGRSDLASWYLYCHDVTGYFACHDYTSRATPGSSSSISHRVGVYVDCPAGTLSFYSVFPNALIHLYTFDTKLTEPLYAGFKVNSPGSTVSLCVDS